ncbi:MAG: hypothetical protein WC663_04230 [Patescibacteria group bacterium]|jgi:hypothetical protein
MARKSIDVPNPKEQEAFYKGKSRSARKKGKSGKGVVIEEAPTVAEIGAPTIKEETAPTLPEAQGTEVADKDVKEVDENGQPITTTGVKAEHKITQTEKGGATEEEKASLRRAAAHKQIESAQTIELPKVEPPKSSLEEGLPEEDVLAQMVRELKKDTGQEVATAEVLEILNAGNNEQFLDPEFDAQFDSDWQRVETALDLALVNPSGEDVDTVIYNTDTLVRDTERLALVKKAEEDQIWDTELGRQRVESLTRFAKDRLDKAGKSLKSFFSGPVKNTLTSFGKTMTELGYGAVSAGENLPKIAMKRMDSGLRTVSEEAVKAYKEMATDFPIEIARTKRKIAEWERFKKEQAKVLVGSAKEKMERREYEKLKAQEVRFKELRAKFGE